jgi:hypothetical protein
MFPDVILRLLPENVSSFYLFGVTTGRSCHPPPLTTADYASPAKGVLEIIIIIIIIILVFYNYIQLYEHLK